MHIDEIITDASGLRSHKFPQEEADRIERLLKGDIASDDELVENEEVSDEDSTDEPPKRAFVSTRLGNSVTRLQLFWFITRRVEDTLC